MSGVGCQDAVVEEFGFHSKFTRRGKGELMKSFRELRVWQQAMDLVEKVYRLTQTFQRKKLTG